MRRSSTKGVPRIVASWAQGRIGPMQGRRRVVMDPRLAKGVQEWPYETQRERPPARWSARVDLKKPTSALIREIPPIGRAARRR